MFEGISKHSLVLMVILKHDKVCDGVFLEQSMPIDRRSSSRRQAPTPVENCEICTHILLIMVKIAAIM